VRQPDPKHEHAPGHPVNHVRAHAHAQADADTDADSHLAASHPHQDARAHCAAHEHDPGPLAAAQVLRARTDAGDEHAAISLACLLAKRGDLDELRARTDVGDEEAAGLLPRLLIEQGRGEEGERLRRFGLTPDGSIASR
jgi:hypothetical protein